MKTLRIFPCLLFIALWLSLSSSATAAPITYHVDGTITHYSVTELPSLIGAVAVGDPFAGTLSYDDPVAGLVKLQITVGTAGAFSAVYQPSFGTFDFISIAGWQSDLSVPLGYFNSYIIGTEITFIADNLSGDANFFMTANIKSITAIPETATGVLLAVGIGGLFIFAQIFSPLKHRLKIH